MEKAALTFEFVGTLLIAHTALRVHYRFLHEHKVNERVFGSMRRELRFGFLGVVFIIIGYVLQVFL